MFNFRTFLVVGALWSSAALGAVGARCESLFGPLADLKKSQFLAMDNSGKTEFLNRQFGFHERLGPEVYQALELTEAFSPLSTKVTVSDKVQLAARKIIRKFEDDIRENGAQFLTQALIERKDGEENVWAVMVAKKTYTHRGIQIDPVKYYYFDWGSTGQLIKEVSAGSGSALL